MKKITVLSLLLFSALSVNAQDAKKEIDEKKEKKKSEYNQWSVEATIGNSKGIKPYSEGYFSSNSSGFLGNPLINSYTLGTRYMISPKFGLNGKFHFAELENAKNNGSLPFKMQLIGFSIEGVINATRLLEIESLGKFGLLFHGGMRIDAMTSKTENTLTSNQNYNVSEYNGGLILGITPQYRISKKMSLMLDISYQNNLRQHFNWDGSSSASNNNLNGQMISTSFGLSYSIGHNTIHGDWAKLKSNSLAQDEIETLNKRILSLETAMLDNDKDGVADYLDQENNSAIGVTVDTKGRTTDQNKNGNSVSKDGNNKTQSDAITKLINDGYVSVYFDIAKNKPTSISIEGLEFIRTFMKNYPTRSIVIYGHADETGPTANNDRLASERALSVKEILVKSGIRASRLFIASEGEDTSVNKNSIDAKKLVRRVTFKIVE